MGTKLRFSPLCDVHHTPMHRHMLEEPGPEPSRSFHACDRPNCARVFRQEDGYSDWSNGAFDGSRASARVCPVCSGTMYLAEVNHAWKLETWECTRQECECVEEISSPSGQ